MRRSLAWNARRKSGIVSAVPKPVVAVLIERRVQEMVLDEAIRAEMESHFSVRWPGAAGELKSADAVELLRDAEGCMTGWESPRLSAEVLQQARRLKVVAHSAGSVKHIVSDELWRRGILVTSAAAQNAIDTAQFAVALMVIARKNMMELADPSTLSANWRAKKGHRRPDDLRGCTVGVVGASRVGRSVLRLLAAFEVRRLVYDPLLGGEQAWELGAEKVELDELFRRSEVVSLHAPALPETRHMVNAARLALMKDGAVLINTARGSLVDHGALAAELRRRRIWAFLDVLDPEPPAPDAPVFGCPNLTITPHLAGAVGRSQKRLGRSALEELKRFFAGQPPLYAVKPETLAYSA